MRRPRRSAPIGTLLDLSVAALLSAALLRRCERASRRGARDAVRRLQRQRLAALLRHAAERSPFYRRRWGGRVPTPDELSELEPVDRRTLLVDQFDAAVTRPGLDRQRARELLPGDDGRPRAAIRMVATSGTTGEPALVPFTHADWRLGMAGIIRTADLMVRGAGRATGSSPPGSRRAPAAAWWHLLRERPRVAGISTLNPMHISTQMSASFALGLVPSLRLVAGSPIGEQVERLERFRPTVLGGYPSAIAPLVDAAAAGTLRIAPQLVFTGGETVTPVLRRRVREAWGVEVFDSYGLSETLIVAGECEAHRGMHLYEDLVVLEVVDEQDRVLPPGERGAAVLLTSLVNRTLPFIRYRVGDLVTVDEAPCPCGLTLPRIVAVEGRREEMLSLATSAGECVDVHPFAIETPLEEIDGVRAMRVEAGPDGGVSIALVPERAGEGEVIRQSAHARVAGALRPLGIPPDRVQVAIVASLDARRGPTGKRLRE
ncbi:MAG: AMP-binding protein [Candidatus Eiseniibacteriota bacterium]